jgi:Putative peptidoglycan binding domain
MDMDGGREVHALQVCLGRQGYHCGDDEMRWWQFGSSTADALKTFQACSGLPESGVTDEATWQALLGPGAAPADLVNVVGSESSYEDDMTQPEEGAVWLIGEQRWSRPV